MKLNKLSEELNLKVLSGKIEDNMEISTGYCSDLLSDVMGNAKEGMLWITIQTHRNILAVASLKDIAAIIIANGQTPDDETLAKSKEEEILILGTDDTAFNISGRIYSLLNS